MVDCIAGYHLNPWTCGIAKFNAILGKALDVPVVGLSSPDLRHYARPLLSIKMSEFTPEDAQSLAAWVNANAGRFDIFLHAFDGTPFENSSASGLTRKSGPLKFSSSTPFSSRARTRPTVTIVIPPRNRPPT